MYLWLGEKLFESEYVVYEDDKIYDAAKEQLESRIEELGFDTFMEWVWENHIDERYVRDYLYEDYNEYVRQSPEDWNINKELTDQQKRYLEIHQANIDRLNQKLEDGGLTDEEQEEIENDIYDYEQLMEDINENPEGDYDEESIEEAIENMVDDNVDNIFDLLRERGYDNHSLLDFVDVDAAIDYVIRTDGYGQTLNGYDGTADSYTINGEEYYVMRYN
jgi:type I site-specific restriction-modification system R (restriction) subunit